MGWSDIDHMRHYIAYDDGSADDVARQRQQALADPANHYEIILKDNSRVQGVILPEHIQTQRVAFQHGWGKMYYIRYRSCEFCQVEGRKDFYVCSLVADGIWRECEGKELLPIALELGVAE